MTEETSKAIVFDTGSGFCKAGMAGDESPACSFPTAYARDDEEGALQTHLVGKQAVAQKDRLDLVRPVVRGVCEDWEALEHVWQFAYLNQLRLDSTEHPVLTGFYPEEYKIDRETMAMVFFETFQVPAYFSMPSSVMSLYGTGKTTGLVLDSGEEVTSVCPVLEGYPVTHSHTSQLFGGKDVDKYLGTLMKRHHVQDEEVLRDIKERKCYLAPGGLEKEVERFSSGVSKSVSYFLPDETKVEIGAEAVQADEIIMNPSACGYSHSVGVPDMILEALYKVEADIRKEFLNHIVLAGGNTLAKNYSKR